MTLIDTHAHLYDEKFDDDRIDVIARAREAGVAKIISMGDTMAASAQVVQDAEEHPALYAAVGILCFIVGFFIINAWHRKYALAAEIQRGNTAAGIFVFGIFVGLSLVISGAVH